MTPGGKVSTFSATGDGPNGLAVGPDGAFYLYNNGGSRYVEGTSMGQGPHGGVMAGERGRREGARGRGER